MKYRKIIAVFSAILLIFLSACSEKKTETDPEVSIGPIKSNSEINMLCCTSDTFNPYSLKTLINEELCQLLFDPLIWLDNSFVPYNALAESVSGSGNTYTVHLKNATFTDGSEVTGNDVVYSYYLAKDSERFSYLLTEVSAISANGKDVTFSLSRFDPYFENLLTFPIIKSDTIGNQTEDGVEIPPIGSGKYYLNEDKTKLLRNDNYSLGTVYYAAVNLVNAPDSESVNHYIQIGASDIYYENINDGSIIRMDGKRSTVNTCNLIYLGLNLKNGLLKNTYLRYAISAALDREKIATDAYYGNAVATNGFFHPIFEPVKSCQNISTVSNTKIAIENLDEIGYNSINTMGMRVNSYGKELSFSLLVNSDNATRLNAAKVIVKQLKDIGIKITLLEVPYDEYVSRLQSGNFELYLAEVKLNCNMNIQNLVYSGGSAAYGITTEENPNDINCFSYSQIETAVNGYNSGEVTLENLSSLLEAQLPIIPIAYRSGILFYTSNLSEPDKYSQSDLFASFINKIQ